MIRDSLLRIEGNGCGVEIHSIEGAIWITQENDPKDHFLMQGEVFVINRPGLVTIKIHHQIQGEGWIKAYSVALEGYEMKPMLHQTGEY